MDITEFLAVWHDGSDSVNARTSGSTGKPKAITLLKSDMTASARATNEFFGIGPASTVGMALSADYIAGQMMAVRADISGALLIQLPVSNDIELPDDYRIDLLSIVPSQIESFLRHPEYVERVGNLLIGGAAPSEAACKALSAAGYRFYISYGMTETCSHVALARGDDQKRVFRAMPGIRFGVDEDCRLIINAERFSFGTLQTNDVVELFSPYEFRWRGRADGIINSGGIKLVPEELEALYAPVLASRRYYVSSMPHPQWGEAAVLVIEGEDSENSAI
ncbi:MAG: AMP-binding protein, partial [Muribaculaceae bacterium]|nr:AMP-binding protein [Muribaculaceae bacterium]